MQQLKHILAGSSKANMNKGYGILTLSGVTKERVQTIV